jgi:MFS family permease
MLVRHSTRPGLTIGINGLAGNLGVAFSALLTGFLVKYAGWRLAFIVPGLIAIACGFLFMRLAPQEAEPPSRRTGGTAAATGSFARFFFVMTIASITASFLFNLATNGNAELLRERFVGIVEDPAWLGALLAVVYAIGSVAQIVVGHLIDRVPLKYLYAGIVGLQVPLLALAAGASGWTLYVLMTLFMIAIFGAIPFIDAMTVRYVDDSHRSRVSGMRLTVSFGVSAAAVWLLGPLVKAGGFTMLLLFMAATAGATLAAVLFLPRPAPMPDAPPGSPRAAD